MVTIAAESIPGEAGVDYPIFSQPPDTSFACEGYIQGSLGCPAAPLGQVTTLTRRPSASHSTSAGTTAGAGSPSTPSSVLMEQSSTSSTSFVTGGSMWTVPR